MQASSSMRSCPSHHDQIENHLTRWARQPNEAVRAIFGVEPEAWQDQALQLVRDHRQTAFRSGHGIGKGAFLSWIIILNMLTLYPIKIGVTAPTSRQLEDGLWPELGKWHRRMRVFGDQFEWQHTKFSLKASPDQSFATARTASKDKPEALQGLRTDNTILIADEAPGVPDEIYDAAEGSMTAPYARLVLTGNPTRLNGYFHRAFTAERGTWQTMRISSFESTQVNPKFIEKIRAEHGEHSNAWRIRVLGEFPLQEGGALIPLEVIERAVGADLAAGGIHAWGLDVGGTDGDASALTKRCGPVAYSIEEKPGLDEMAQCGWVKREYEAADIKPSEINVDATGIGSGVASRLVELGLPAKAIKVGINIRPQRRDEPRRWWHEYSNVRAALHYRAAEWMVGGCIPNDRQFIAEASTIKPGGENSQGQRTIEPKDDIRARLGKSPNRWDSFTLTFATGEIGIKGGTKQDRAEWFAARARG